MFDEAKLLATDDDLKTSLRAALKMKMLPPEPIHFEVYPSILAKNKHTRLMHTKLIDNIEKNIIFRRDKDAECFRVEREEREILKKKQKAINDGLTKKINKIQP